MMRTWNVLLLILALMTFLPVDAAAAPLHDASKKGDVAEVKDFLQDDYIDVNSSWFHPTLLYIASTRGQVEVVKVLLASGANMNAKTKGGATPLHEASGNGHAEVVKLLKAAGGKK